MHRAIDLSTQLVDVATQPHASDDRASNASDARVSSNPATIVLQPIEALVQETSLAFRSSLIEALELANENVIVDLLWIEKIDAAGVAALVVGVEKAMTLGKTLSFQAMHPSIHQAVEAEWEQQRQSRLGSWSDRFEANLEHFLSQRGLQQVEPQEGKMAS